MRCDTSEPRGGQGVDGRLPMKRTGGEALLKSCFPYHRRGAACRRRARTDIPLAALDQCTAGHTLSASELMEWQTHRLWEGDAPEARGDSPQEIPTDTVFRQSVPNGTAVIIAPGGGYAVLMIHIPLARDVLVRNLGDSWVDDVKRYTPPYPPEVMSPRKCAMLRASS